MWPEELLRLWQGEGRDLHGGASRTMTLLGIGSAFWGLLAGLLVLLRVGGRAS